MRRALRLFAAVLLSVLLLAGCYETANEPDYTLQGLLVVHNSDAATDEITRVYVTDASSGTWGPNYLVGQVLYPGDSLLLDIYSCDRYYDMRIQYALGAVVEEYGVLLPCDMTTEMTFIDY